MLSSKRIGTHSGHFHLDEVLACVMLTKYTKDYKDAEIIRTRDQKVLDQLDLVCDVGGVYEPTQHRYDHHQREFTGTFSSEHKIKLSSAGLIYKHFGLEIVQNALKDCLQGIKLSIQAPLVDEKLLKLIHQKIYDKFIQSVDALDNGINQYESPGKPLYSINTDLGYQIARTNPMWTEEADENERFRKAMIIADNEFIAQLRGVYLAWLPARQFVEEAFINRKNTHESGQIMKLGQSVPWKSHLYDIEEEQKMEGDIKFVLYQDVSQGWRVQGVNKHQDGFELRQQLNKEWCGIKDMELLKKTTKIDDIVFVHANGFIGGARSYESALRMAQESL